MGRIFLSAKELRDMDGQGGLIAKARALLPEAAALAVVPVSGFRVGAVAIDAQGNAWFGANQEFADVALSQTVHAEQSAIAHAWMGGATQIVHMVVTHAPCGHCRQFMSELHGADTLSIHLPALDIPFRDYLPGRFGPLDLGISAALLQPAHHPLLADARDDAAQAALDAAQTSHAPYSNAHAGFALKTHDGRIFAGRYAENAAYNPGLPALQCALNLLHLNGLRAQDIAEGVLVYEAGQGHAQQTQLLWQALTRAPLRLIEAGASA